MVCRKHPAYLLVALVTPVLIALVALALLGLSWMAGVASLRLAFLWTGTGVAILAAIFGVWRWVDWQNDYYLITNQRVVWLEQVFGLYDSRIETPLNAIKSSEVRSSQIGRILGYGTLTIRAFMGQVVFADIANPGQVKVLLDKQQRIVKEQVLRADQETMEFAVRHKIEPPGEDTTQVEPAKAESKPDTQAKPVRKPFLVRLTNDFRTRLEEGDTVTYRKHTFVLMIKIWAPTLLELALIGATLFLARARIQEEITFPSLPTLFLLSSFLSFGLFLWWLYQYIDWRNDIYQITPEKIVDSERKPLGTEVTKSASLANILSLDYERIGLIGVLLNFGNVNINVGAETRFDFVGIHDPARAQQDIFNRMYDYQRSKQQGDLLKQGEQIVDWIAAYHHQADELRGLEKGDGKSQEPVKFE